VSASASAPKELSLSQRVALAVLAGLLRIWWRTLRFRWGPEVQALMDRPVGPAVVIVWHNRLFASPEFFRRHFAERKLATLISASGDGAWLAGLFKRLGMTPIRGSHYKRGVQAVRDMLAAQRQGYDIAITPDGSRGPMYDLKPGAVAVALKTGAPLVLCSMNFQRAWRLKSWDRFFLPWPFSRIDVLMDVVADPAVLGEDPRQVAGLLKERMDVMTRDLP
jgi:lysophospholipid acyltransferase (LPLAT)-like uncharacterized protein